MRLLIPSSNDYSLKNMKPTLLFISHVIPINPSSGQQQRVLQMITEARKIFEVVFLTYCRNDRIKEVQDQLSVLVDRCIILPSIYQSSWSRKVWYSILAFLYQVRNGLKKSNYIIGQLELTRNRVIDALKDEKIDAVIYEYWHAWRSASVFKDKTIPVILDMHDNLSAAYTGQLAHKQLLPKIIKQRLLEQYSREEHHAWSQFNGIIAINKLEMEGVNKITSNIKLFFCPMGVDLDYWVYSSNPSIPVRFGFYGGLGSAVNLRQALFTINKIMPLLWQELPDVELWLIGSNPTEELRKIAARESRIKVTGFLSDPRPTLANLTALFCPWEGVFGFRSRVVEVMALGVPVIASPDAVAGMGITTGRGVTLANSVDKFSENACQLARNQNYALKQSREGRSEVERKFSTNATYGKLFEEIDNWMK